MPPTSTTLWAPTERQAAFLSSPADEALYGGAAGGGKSAAVVALPLRWVDNGGFNALVLRRDTTQLRDLIAKTEALYPAFGAKLNLTTGTWKFPSGARVWFTHCEHETDVQRFDGQEFHCVVFDELTHFTEKQYRAIRARIRGTDPTLPRYTRATTNPGGPGHEWVFKRFAAWLDPKHPRPSESGRLRWYAGDDEVPRGSPDALSRTFVPAKLDDNPHVTSEYRANLVQLDAHRRAQLLSGDWLAKPAPKDLWDRAKVRHLEHAPSNLDVRARVRCWDFAASEASDADWTVGTLASVTHAGLVVIEHVHRFRGVPAKVRSEFSRIAKADKEHDARTVQWIPQDPAQAGKDQVLSYQTGNPGITVRARPPSGDKIVRFGPASARAAAGNLAVVRGPWLDALHDELEAAPGPKGTKDDQLDTVSDCVAVLTGAVPASLEAPRSLPKPRL
ncbi:MAG: hypothetical protein EKK55_10155 [Rhodocyclaceae bacterium]|nr:MAG: hypothetical protein EKK55_10155 [Rhodocyclaceae bacterium]